LSCALPRGTPALGLPGFFLTHRPLERIVLGAERHVIISAEDKPLTAYHEGGHAIVGMLTEGADPVRKGVDHPPAAKPSA
jgi:hypothetical protein